MHRKYPPKLCETHSHPRFRKLFQKFLLAYPQQVLKAKARQASQHKGLEELQHGIQRSS